MMKSFSKNPLALLLLGALLGGGITQTAWLIKSGKLPDAKQVAEEQVPQGKSRQRRTPTTSMAAGHSGSAGRLDEKAKQLVGGDPEAAWKRALSMANYAERKALTTALMEEWGKTDPLKALGARAEAEHGSRSEAIRAAIRAWLGAA